MLGLTIVSFSDSEKYREGKIENLYFTNEIIDLKYHEQFNLLKGEYTSCIMGQPVINISDLERLEKSTVISYSLFRSLVSLYQKEPLFSSPTKIRGRKKVSFRPILALYEPKKAGNFQRRAKKRRTTSAETYL